MVPPSDRKKIAFGTKLCDRPLGLYISLANGEKYGEEREVFSSPLFGLFWNSLSLSSAGGVRYKAVNSLEMPPSKCLLCSHGQKAVAEEKEEEKTPPNLLFPLPSSVSASLPHTLKEERGREKEKEASKKIYLDPQPAKNGTVKILYDSSKKYGRLRLPSSFAVKV